MERGAGIIIMRLFISINFDNNIIDELTKFQKLLIDMGVKGNYSKEENLHLTLAFIGEYHNPDDIIDIINQVEFEPFELELDGVGRFNDIFWVGIKDNEYLQNYVKRLRNELSNNNIPFDRKRFKPHITLIRRTEYKEIKIPVEYSPTGKMTVQSITLMKSERGKDGMIYTPLN